MAIDSSIIPQFLAERDVSLITGVPDSLLADLIEGVEDIMSSDSHVIGPNEGACIGLAIGHYLSGAGPAAVYMQNSGLGNAINPLLSLAHFDVYSIPMILFVGWRGEPGTPDEPQHLKQGECTPALLEAMGLWWRDLGENDDALEVLQDAWANMIASSSPVVVLVKRGAISHSNAVLNLNASSAHQSSKPTREDAISKILDVSLETDLVVATTGKIGRELYELRVAKGQPNSDFLTVGGMGHASAIGLGVARGQDNRRVICLDGDGALLMHMGTMSLIGTQARGNYIHVVLNNGTHESVGGQPTVANKLDFEAISIAMGYKKYYRVRALDEIDEIFCRLELASGPSFIEVFVASGSRKNLGRPNSSPAENKKNFMRCMQ